MLLLVCSLAVAENSEPGHTFEEGTGGARLLFALGNLHSGAAEGEKHALAQCWRRNCNLNQQQEESLLITRPLAPDKKVLINLLSFCWLAHTYRSQPGVYSYSRSHARAHSAFCSVQTFGGIRQKNSSLCSACDDNRYPLFLLMWSFLRRAEKMKKGHHVQKMVFAKR